MHAGNELFINNMSLLSTKFEFNLVNIQRNLVSTIFKIKILSLFKIVFLLLLSSNLCSCLLQYESQTWLEVLKPSDVSYSYKIRPARNFGYFSMNPFRQIKLVPTNPPQACGQLIDNGHLLRGQAALITRGECSFVSKVINAELYGAIAVIISDNNMDNYNSWIEMVSDETDRDPRIGIPAYFLRGRDGEKIRTSLQINGIDAALINVPVNYTNNDALIMQPPWDPW